MPTQVAHAGFRGASRREPQNGLPPCPKGLFENRGSAGFFKTKRDGFKAEAANNAAACRGFPTQETPVLDKKTAFAIFQTSPNTKEIYG